jgi:hypothetical protein
MQTRMKVSIKEEVLAICQTVGNERSDVVWQKGDRVLAKTIGTDSALNIRPGWHFPRGVPMAGADWILQLQNGRARRTFKDMFGYAFFHPRSDHFAKFDRRILERPDYVIERNEDIDVASYFTRKESLFYLESLPDWLNESIDIGLRLANEHFDLGSDRGVLRSTKPANDVLAFKPGTLMIEMMLGSREAAQAFLATTPVLSGDMHDKRAMDQIRTLVARVNDVPAI